MSGKVTAAQHKWLELIDRNGNVTPGHGAAWAATKLACERRGWTETVKSDRYNVRITRLTDLGRAAIRPTRTIREAEEAS